jgi:hypothetical protein
VYGAGVTYYGVIAVDFLKINVYHLLETFMHGHKRSTIYTKAFLPFRNQPKILGTSLNASEFSGLNVFLLVTIKNVVSVVLKKQQGDINIHSLICSICLTGRLARRQMLVCTVVTNSLA